MHKRHLWIDRRGADLTWPALGNVNIGATGKGTLAYWVRYVKSQNAANDDKL